MEIDTARTAGATSPWHRVRPSSFPAIAGLEAASGAGISWKGWWAFSIALSMALSSIEELRPVIAGAAVHPYLIVVGLAGLALVAKNAAASEGLGGWGPLLVFVIIAPDAYFASTLSTKLVAKWIGVAATFIVVERLCQRPADFRAGVFGVAIAVAFIAARGLFLYGGVEHYYVNVMAGLGSRNAFNPWAGSAFAMAIPYVLSKQLPRWQVILLSACIVVASVPLVLSLSRGGWVILLSALYPLVRRLNARSVLLAVIAGLVLLRIVERYQFEDRLERRYEDFVRGTASDERRRDLVDEGFDVFLHNPVLGVGLSQVPLHLADPLFGPTESHNLFIDFLAGTGMLGSGCLLATAYRLLKNRTAAIRAGTLERDLEVENVVPMLLGLILIAGMTSNEVLYYPPIVFGLAAANGVLCAAAREGASIRRLSLLRLFTRQEPVRP